MERSNKDVSLRTTKDTVEFSKSANTNSPSKYGVDLNKSVEVSKKVVFDTTATDSIDKASAKRGSINMITYGYDDANNDDRKARGTIWKLWNDYCRNRNIITTHGDPMVKSYRLPLMYPARSELLQLFVNVATVTRRTELFKNEVVRIAIDEAWDSYGRRYHIILTIAYGMLLVASSLANYTFNKWVRGEKQVTKLHSASVAFVAVSLTLTMFFVGIEMCQMKRQMVFAYETSRRSDHTQYKKEAQKLSDSQIIKKTLASVVLGLRSYATDIFNVLDITGYFLLIVGNVFRLVAGTETVGTSAVLCIATLLLWFKCIYFLRPFESTGPLVRMVFHIAFTILPFCLLLVVVLFGFSQALFLLSYTDSSLTFGRPHVAFLQVYVAMTTGGCCLDMLSEG
jgi:hypothetical protein